MDPCGFFAPLSAVDFFWESRLAHLYRGEEANKIDGTKWCKARNEQKVGFAGKIGQNGYNSVTRPPIIILSPLFTLQLLILPTRAGIFFDAFGGKLSYLNFRILGLQQKLLNFRRKPPALGETLSFCNKK